MSDMKLHEAIRLGAMVKPQGRGAFYTPNGTCAAGAALDAIGRLDTTACAPNAATSVAQIFLLRECFPILANLPNFCPACERPFSGGWGFAEMQLAHLNDIHRWTREQIADWVQTIEDAQATRIECADQVSMEPAFALPSAAPKVSHD